MRTRIRLIPLAFSLAFWATALVPVTAALAPPAWAQAAGTDCARAGDPLARLICASPELRTVSLANARVFSSLRQQVGRAAERGLVEGAAATQQALLRTCGISMHGAEPAVGTEAFRDREACVLAGLRAQHDAWLGLLSGPAREEARRPVEALAQGQMDLRRLGLLDERSVADGTYRGSTRAAILRWQAMTGRPETGLLGDADAAALHETAETPPAPVPSPMVMTRPAEGTVQIDVPVDLATGPPMRFTPDVALVPGAGPEERRVIYADGAIAPGSPDALAAVLATGWPAGSVVVLSSPGGNAVAGLRMGRMIRAAGFFTIVGRRGPGGVDFHNARCFSACADMFLGGVQRLHASGALLGVHQSRLPEALDVPPERVAEGMRALRALRRDYLLEMGVDTDLLDEAERAEAQRINILPPGRLAELRVITSGGGSAWALVTVSGQRYLRSFVSTGGGVHFAAIACPERGGRAPVLFVNLRDPDGGKMSRATHWPVRLEADGVALEVTPADIAAPARLVEQTLGFALRLTPRLMASLSRARIVRVERVAPDGGGRVGMELDMSAGWGEVGSFLQTCR